jgi:hypothetical protein
MYPHDPGSGGSAGYDSCHLDEVGVEEVADAVIEPGVEGEGLAANVQPRPIQPMPIQPRPIQPRPIQPMPIQPMPIRPVPIRPVPPIRLPQRPLSGRYRGRAGIWELELRVDVDGVRPLKHVSGDFFRVEGATRSYFGSFVAADVGVTVSSGEVRIEGVAELTYGSSFNRIEVTIPRTTLLQQPGQADLRWRNARGSQGARYLCDYESRFFRSLDIEEDVESGVTPFASYDSGSLPSGGPARTLTIASAFAEAGLELRSTGEGGVIPTAPGGTWSDAELHAAMEAHFTQWADQPQWKVWLLHARLHDLGPGLLGIMFDQHGRQRQGCATFYHSIGGTSATRLRDQLYTCVHELGHCFNLFHSFHKHFMTPPQPNRLGALSWMNYPQRFPGGAGAFWSGFPFQFDELETIHLRHAARNSVIMGGNPFGEGAALEAMVDFADPEQDASGLDLELRVDRSFRLGEPVVVELKLSSTVKGPKRVHRHLHPNDGFVTIAIQKPGGAVVVHEPLITHCVQMETTVLDEAQPAIYDSAYVGYGDDRMWFDQPGVYRLRAIYLALDGSQVVSSTLQLRVRNPHDDADEEVADLLLDDQVGQLLTLLGSDSDQLAAGNARIETLLDKHDKHPLGVYGRLVKGFALARPFKKLRPDGSLTVRDTKADEAVKLLDSVVADSAEGRGLDNISLNQTLRRIVRTHKAEGDQRAAERAAKRLVDVFKKRGLTAHVLAEIERQRQEALADEPG